MSIDRWMGQQHVVGAYSGISFSPKEEGSSDTHSAWINFDHIRLREISLSGEDRCCKISLYEAPEIVKFIETIEWQLPEPGQRRERKRFISGKSFTLG